MCEHPSAEHWRDRLKETDDAQVAEELRIAWDSSYKKYLGPPYEETHHDWTHYRAITLREARKRGLDLSVAGR